jgi:uncharacterized protein (TIGR00251 family)
MADVPWRAVSSGISIDVRVTPKASRDVVDGIEQLANGQAVLKLRVRAAPSEGEANEAVIALLAKSLRVPKSSLTLERGAGSRIKTLKISGEAATIIATLKAAVTKARGKT